MNKNILNITSPILNSYSQLFFSKNNWFAVLLALSTFIKWEIGVAGFICLITAILTAKTLGYTNIYIKDGTYTFNSLMAGMALAIYFKFTWPFIFLLVIAGILSFFISLVILNWTSKSGLPLLSWTFIIVTWLGVLGASNFTSFEFLSNDSVQLSSSPLQGLAGELDGWLNRLGLPDLAKIYLRSLGAIMFQYNTLAGLIIFIGLIIYSRIASLLSLIGFFVGFLFYDYFEGDFTQLIFSYIGFNFILTAIALGGFFIVPNWKSFLLVACVIPIIALLISALNKFFALFGLPLFSLPFCVMVTLLLLGLKYRTNPKNLLLVTNQQFSPEENMYQTELFKSRFNGHSNFHFSLPFMGEWTVSQGYNGGITHIGEWQHALDFDIRNSRNKTFQEPGYELPDYYCYELPITAPAPGSIIKVENKVDENPVGGVNLSQNWGNTVIIKHAEGLYSKLSHLKIGTITVKEGDFINKGDFIGKLGNSGRSPEPHLHFQLQTTPYIGSKTLPYPIAYYLSKKNNNWHFNEFQTPSEGELVKNIEQSTLLSKAFGWIPGQSLSWKNGAKKIVWDVLTDAFNHTYHYDKSTNSSAYFTNNGTVFYFTNYVGDTKCELFQFYLAAQKVLLSNIKNTRITDTVHLKYFSKFWTKWLHDLAAPFFSFINVKYTSEIKDIENDSPSSLAILSFCRYQLFGKTKKEQAFNIQIKDNKITAFSFHKKDIKTTLKCD